MHTKSDLDLDEFSKTLAELAEKKKAVLTQMATLRKTVDLANETCAQMATSLEKYSSSIKTPL